ncbi:MAG: hypothetical protein KKH58_05890 [Gammaproteobacteria bacterium]|nr:hypothetical protein [Gammaproteobacteria bacterium]
MAGAHPGQGVVGVLDDQGRGERRGNCRRTCAVRYCNAGIKGSVGILRSQKNHRRQRQRSPVVLWPGRQTGLEAERFQCLDQRGQIKRRRKTLGDQFGIERLAIETGEAA